VRPYTLLGRTIEEIEDVICKLQPLKPSAAAARNGIPRGVARSLAGDLDNIVLRAMHKEPQRRYASAAALSDDIQRYLDDRPVQARADAWTYRASKFLRRNLVAASVAGTVTLMIAILVTFYTVQLTAERDRAATEAAKSAQVAQFLTDIFRVADPKQAQGRQVTALELLDRGAQDIDERLAGQPLVRADLLFAIGLSYKNLSAYDRAGPLLEQSLAIKAAARLEQTREYAQMLYELANLRRFEGRFAESERHFRRTLEIQQRIFVGPHEDTAATLTHLAVLYYEMKRPEESLLMQQRALEMTRAVFGEHHAATADRMNNLSLVLQDLDRYGEAETYLRQAIRIQHEVLGERHPDVLISRYNLALLLRATGRHSAAATLLRELLPIRKAVLGEGHPSVGLTLSALGSALTGLRRYDEAQQALDEARDLLTGKLGESHWRVGVVLRQLGQLALARGAPREAEAYLLSALTIEIDTYGDQSTAAHKTRSLLAAALERRGDLVTAETLLESSYKSLQAEAGVRSVDIIYTLEELGRLRARQGRDEEALALLRQAVENYQRIGGRNNPDAAQAVRLLAQISERQSASAAAGAHR
jgi:eukaryotic-like serine/threonine-protein kinase